MAFDEVEQEIGTVAVAADVAVAAGTDAVELRRAVVSAVPPTEWGLQTGRFQPVVVCTD